jgi:hypothetical protein
MILHVLMGQRKESYPGQYAPEALAIIDEYGHSDNPDYMAAERAKQTATGEFESLAVLDLDVSGPAIMAHLRPKLKAALAANVVGSDVEIAPS